MNNTNHGIEMSLADLSQIPQHPILCKPLMTAVMNCIRQSDDRCYLGTSTGRRAAIKVYLDFGFSPDPRSERESQVWAELSKAMDHPLLKHFVSSPNPGHSDTGIGVSVKNS